MTEEWVEAGARAVHVRQRTILGLGLKCGGPQTCATCQEYMDYARDVIAAVEPLIHAELRAELSVAYQRGWDAAMTAVLNGQIA